MNKVRVKYMVMQALQIQMSCVDVYKVNGPHWAIRKPIGRACFFHIR